MTAVLHDPPVQYITPINVLWYTRFVNRLFSSEKIYVAQSKIPHAGRGVFANVTFKKGDVIERCPVIVLPEHEEQNLEKSILATYMYFLGQKKKRLTLALGFGSIYNHTHQPNAMYKDKYKEAVIEFVAIKDIEKDEEITVNYSQGNKKDNSPLWFEVTRHSK